jgi:filamentous hemagglutinin
VRMQEFTHAPVTTDQSNAFREMFRDGATIMGKGKPGFPGGMKIPPTQVKIWRPESQ